MDKAMAFDKTVVGEQAADEETEEKRHKTYHNLKESMSGNYQRFTIAKQYELEGSKFDEEQKKEKTEEDAAEKTDLNADKKPAGDEKPGEASSEAAGAGEAAGALVERFDIEPHSDFSAK